MSNWGSITKERTSTVGFYNVSRWAPARSLKAGDRFITGGPTPDLHARPGSASYSVHRFDHWVGQGDGTAALIDTRGHHCGIYSPDELIPLTDDCPNAR
jgi:hypothetical protein